VVVRSLLAEVGSTALVLVHTALAGQHMSSAAVHTPWLEELRKSLEPAAHTPLAVVHTALAAARTPPAEVLSMSLVLVRTPVARTPLVEGPRMSLLVAHTPLAEGPPRRSPGPAQGTSADCMRRELVRKLPVGLRMSLLVVHTLPVGQRM